MKAIIDLLKDEKVVTTLLSKNKTIVCSDNQDEALVIASAFRRYNKPILVVENNLYAAQGLYERLSGLLKPDECLFFPSDESFRIEAMAASKELIAQRLYVMSSLASNKNAVIIAHTASIVRFLPPFKLFKGQMLDLKLGDVIDDEGFIKYLTSVGYERVNKIEHSLQFARRGGVIDIYSVNYENPIRIELFGNEIDSIRFFNLDSQKTIKQIKDVTIAPASELLLESDYEKRLEKLVSETHNEKVSQDLLALKETHNETLLYKYYSYFQDNIESIVDYVSDDTLLILSNLDYIKENYKLLYEESFDYLESEEGYVKQIILDLLSVLNKKTNMSFINEFRKKDSDVESPIQGVESAYGNTKVIYEIVNEYLKEGNKVVLCVENKNQLDCLLSWAKDYGLKMEYGNYDELPKKQLTYVEYALKDGFKLPKQKLVYIGAHELFGTRSVNKSNVSRYRSSVALQSYENLSIGDFVIHEVHGIGKFLGIESIETNGIHRDYLHIGYRNNGVLYVPLEQFRLIRKYVAKEGNEPRLNKLGSDEWKKTKAKIKARISDIADRLMVLYSNRVEKQGYAFAKDSEWQAPFEASFPFELTKDQARSVEEIKKDMESPYPMDRLLCGDVGFGKTEVAWIAAFKAIMSGKQVALLCPTTLLAKQHFDNALDRFKNYPISIGVLNRFVSEKEQNKYLKAATDGSLDILIGTHRLLSKDVKFKDLGLLIVDEEQRFGVEHKEIIKEMKNSVDVLTLSATPIPRTLQMALIGIRSLSQLDTPPEKRMPVQTYVIEKNDKMIKEIIERELARHGQVFYLYNRVDRINSIASSIQKSVKGAKVICVHGQMNRDDVEEAMYRFNNQEANVMVCTSIIENGIDIPNANTIIVEDADKFGLSQLYQIKGRVGRGDRLAYAYLLYTPRKQLSEIATKRLRAIKEFAELGSGYKIAMRDLTIRGAGDILGAEQSGFIDMVGIDTYIRLLNEAIEERKSGVPTPEIEIHKPLNIDAYINKGFTNDDLDKINLYQKIDEVNSVDELLSLEKDMKDIYGKLPKNVKLLLEKRRLELFETDDIVSETKDSLDDYEIIFSEEFAHIDGIGIDLFKITGETSPHIKLSFRANKIKMTISKKDELWLDHTISVLEKLKIVLNKTKK